MLQYRVLRLFLDIQHLSLVLVKETLKTLSELLLRRLLCLLNAKSLEQRLLFLRSMRRPLRFQVSGEPLLTRLLSYLENLPLLGLLDDLMKGHLRRIIKQSTSSSSSCVSIQSRASFHFFIHHFHILIKLELSVVQSDLFLEDVVLAASEHLLARGPKEALVLIVNEVLIIAVGESPLIRLIPRQLLHLSLIQVFWASDVLSRPFSLHHRGVVEGL